MKDKSRLIKVAVIGAIILAILASSRYQKQIAELENIKEGRIKQLNDGTAPPIAGPFYLEGDPSSLKFDVVDLGLALNCESSNQGDLLYQCDGAQKTNTPFYRIRHCDGTIVDYPPASKVFLTSGGTAYAVTPTKDGYRLEKNGKVVFDPRTAPKGSRINLALSDAVKATDEGLFLSSEEKGIHSYLSNDLKLVKINVPQGQSVSGIFNSTKLGTYLNLVENSPSENFPTKSSRGILKDGRIEDLPDPPSDCPSPAVTICEDTLYFVPDVFIAESYLFEYRNGKFSKLPSIPGSFKMSLVSANSHREFIIRATFKNHEKGGLPTVERTILVSAGKFFDLEKIKSMPRFGNEDKLTSPSISPQEFKLTESGDIISIKQDTNGSHLFLLRRQNSS